MRPSSSRGRPRARGGCGRAARAPERRVAGAAARRRGVRRPDPARGRRAVNGQGRSAAAWVAAPACAQSGHVRARVAGAARIDAAAHGRCRRDGGHPGTDQAAARCAARGARRDALHVDAQHARALALAEGRDREPREVTQLRLRTIASSRPAAICRRSSSRSTSNTPPRDARLRIPRLASRTACSSVARKKNRSKTRSKTRRSSGDLAIVAASVSAELGRGPPRSRARAR